MTWSPAQLETWIDRQLIDRGGHKIGTITDVYMDDSTGLPEWLAVSTGWFGNRVLFVPLDGAQESGEEKVRVPHEKRLVKDSPNVAIDGELTKSQEESLYRHYGLSYGRNRLAEADELGTTDTERMQEAGSASQTGDMTIEAARRRLSRRDKDLVNFIDLDANDENTPQESADSER